MNQASCDNEFASLDMALRREGGVALNMVARDEQVPQIEPHIRTVKDRCRAIFNMLSFRKIPARMIIELVYAMTFWLHALSAVDGVSTTIIPRELVNGVTLRALKHFVLPFGAYVHTYEQHDNSMQARRLGRSRSAQPGTPMEVISSGASAPGRESSGTTGRKYLCCSI